MNEFNIIVQDHHTENPNVLLRGTELDLNKWRDVICP